MSTGVRYEQMSPRERAAVDRVSWEDPGCNGGIGRPSTARRHDGALLAYYRGEEDEVPEVLLQPPAPVRVVKGKR